MRISLTDRCNFHCFYCRPHCQTSLAAKESILTFEELSYITEIFVGLGIEKVRLTGGEPLLRRNLSLLIEDISRLKAGNCRLKDLAMTTNGYGLHQLADTLKRAGLDRVTISLDSLEPDNFRRITGADRLDKVLDGIKAAQDADLSPIKINAVIIRNRNDHEIAALAGFARKTGVSMRFIEYMPLDSANQWRREDVVSGREIYTRIDKHFPLRPAGVRRGSETASRYTFADGAPGEIGIITPVTASFCGQCSRIRLTADGQIRTCLFSTREYDLRDLIRRGASRDETIQFIRSAVLEKQARHFINSARFQPASRSMSLIGG